MFRAAATLYLLMGAFAVWRYGFTDHDPSNRLWGLALGAAGMLIAVMLFRNVKAAIVLSAIGAALVAICAAVAAPVMHGPAILVFALIALLAGAYAALAGRVLLRSDR